MTTRDEMYRLTGAYALGALEPHEQAEFEAWLAENDSEDMRTEVAEMTDTAVLLGLSATPIAPPAELKMSLLAAIATTPQLPRLDITPAPASVATPVEASADDSARIRSIASGAGISNAGASDARGMSRGQHKAQARWFTRPIGVLAAVAAAAAVFVGGSLVGSAVNAPTELEQQAAGFIELSSASDVQNTAHDVEGGGTIRLYWSGELQRSAVVASSLPALADGETYQLWYIGAEGPTSAGTFSSADDGQTVRVLDGEMHSGDTVGITVEPAGGSDEPTSTPIFAVETA